MSYKGKYQSNPNAPQKRPQHRKYKKSPRQDRESFEIARAIRTALREDLTEMGAQRLTNTANQEIFLLTIKKGNEEKTIILQQKAAFGGLGDGLIQVRVHNKQLVGNADWIIAFNKHGNCQALPSSKLREYIAQHWGTISKKATTQLRGTLAVPIRLEDFFRTMEITPINLTLGKKTIPHGIELIRKATFGKAGLFPPRKKIPSPKKEAKPAIWGGPTQARLYKLAKQMAHPQMQRVNSIYDRRRLVQKHSNGMMRRGR